MKEFPCPAPFRAQGSGIRVQGKDTPAVLAFRSLATACCLLPPVLLLGLALSAVARSEQPSAKEQSNPSKDGAAQKTRRDVRLDLIRGLQSEVAVAKIAMPRGKRGVYLNARGQLDQGKADAELRQNGAAVRPGMPVEITKLSFKGDHITFEINHGGKSGKKWYQHIYIGMGTADQPIVPDKNTPVLAYGSWISLKVPGKLEDLTAPRVKTLLGAALDFERHAPTVLYSASVPPKIKEAIKKHEVLVGMDRDAVLSAKGPPDRKVREVREGAEQEDWIYGLPPHSLFVTFDSDTVTAVHQY